MSKDYSGRNQRRVFRLMLPLDGRLIATIDGESFEVIEVAELSLLLNASVINNRNGFCEGVIQWSDDSESHFHGEIGCLKGENRVIWKIVGISMQDVVGEQRRVLSKYPHLQY